MLSTSVKVLRRQRKYAKTKKQYREAFEGGMKLSQEYFSEPVLDETRACIRKGKWEQTCTTC
jgi:hypothetical protein